MRIVAILFITAALWAQETKTVLRVYHYGALVPRPEPRPLDESDWHEAAFTMVGPVLRFREVPEDMFLDHEGADWGDVATGVTDLIESVAKNASVKVVGESLLVRAAIDDHQRIAKLFESLAGGGEPYEIEVSHLAIPRSALSPRVRRMLEEAVRGKLGEEDRKMLASLDRNKGNRGATVSAPPGRWTQYRSLRRMTYVPDYEVEIAQAASIADPIALRATEGLKVALRPFPLQDGRTLLRVFASAGDLDKDMRRFEMRSPERTENLRLRNTDYGVLEQSDFRGCAVSTEMVLKPGATAGMLSGYSGELAHVLLFRLKKAPPAPKPGTFVVMATGALSAEDPPHAFTEWEGHEIVLSPREGEAGRIDVSTLSDLLRNELIEDEGASFLHWSSWLRGGAAVVRASTAKATRVLDALRTLERALLEPLRIDFKLSNGGQFSGPLLAGRRAAFGAFHRLDYVGDYNVEVAQEARIADPVHSVAYAGIFANVTVHPTSSGEYFVRIELRLLGMTEGIRKVASHAGGIPGLQSVPVREIKTVVRARLKAGVAHSLDLGRSPFGAGRLKATITIHRG